MKTSKIDENIIKDSQKEIENNLLRQLSDIRRLYNSAMINDNDNVEDKKDNINNIIFETNNTNQVSFYQCFHHQIH